MIEFIINFYRFLAGSYENALILSSILSFAATLILVFITRKYVLLTKFIAEETSRSVNISKEKEKIDRSLNFIDRYERKDLTESESIAESSSYLNEHYIEFYDKDGFPVEGVVKKGEINWRINRILSLFNLLAYLLKKEKIDYDIIKDNFGEEMIDFAWNYQTQLKQLISLNKEFNLKKNYKNYFNLCIELEKELNVIDTDKRDDFLKDLKQGFN